MWVHAKLLQLCLTLCFPMDCSPPGSSGYGILQARILNGLPFLPAGDLPGPALEAASLRSSALAGRFFNTYATREDHYLCGYYYWCSSLFPVDSNYCAVLFNFSLEDSLYCFL